MKRIVIAVLLLLLPIRAWATPASCTISGTVYDPTNSPLPNATITFNSQQLQVINGQSVAAVFKSTTTNSSGVLTPIVLSEGLSVQVTVCDQYGSCNAPFGATVPLASTTTFGNLAQGVTTPGGITGTSLSVNGQVNLTGNGSASNIDNIPIGQTTRQPGAFTTATTTNFTAGPGAISITGDSASSQISGVQTSLFYDPKSYGVSFSTNSYTGTFTSGSATITGLTGHDFDSASGKQGLIAYGKGAACVVGATACASVSLPTPTLSRVVRQQSNIPGSATFTITVNDSAANDVTEIIGVTSQDSHRPYVSGSVAAGSYTSAIVAGVATLTFSALDARQKVDIYARVSGAGPGPNSCTAKLAFYPTGTSALTQATTVSNTFACAATFNVDNGMAVTWTQLSNTDKVAIYESDDGGTTYYGAGLMWQSGTDIHLNRLFCNSGTCTWVQFGQATSAEDMPTTPPSVAVNDALRCDVASTTSTSVTCGGGITAGASGTSLVYHDDYDGWSGSAGVLTAVNAANGGRIALCNGCVSRSRQIVFPASSLGLQIEGAAILSELDIFGDGGGPLQTSVNGSSTANGGIVLSAGSQFDTLTNFLVRYSNGALDAIINDGAGANGSNALDNLNLSWLNGVVDNTTQGTNTTGIVSTGTAFADYQNVTISNVQRDYKGFRNGTKISNGSLRNSWPGRWFNGMFEWDTTTTGFTVDKVTLENPWTGIRPIKETNSFRGGIYSPIYQSDQVASHGMNPTGATAEIQSINFGVSYKVGCAATNSITGLHVMNDHLSGASTIAENMGFTGCLNGMVADGFASVFGAQADVASGGVGFELRSSGDFEGLSMPVANATSTAFKLGYLKDESTCASTSKGHLSYPNSAFVASSTLVDACAGNGVNWDVVADGVSGNIPFTTAESGGGTLAAFALVNRWQTVTIADNSAFTIPAPTNAAAGQVWTVELDNNAGVTSGAITLNAVFQTDSSWSNTIASATKRICRVTSQATNLFQLGSCKDNGASANASTVNSGTINQLAYYAAAGTVLSGESQATTAQGGLGADASGYASGKYPKATGSGGFAASTLGASGTGACTNQVVSGLNGDAAPTCHTVTSSDVNSSVLNTATAPDAGTRTATSGRYPKGDGTNWNTSSGSASGTGACSANNWASTLNSDAAPTCTRPACSSLSDSATSCATNATTTINDSDPSSTATVTSTKTLDWSTIVAYYLTGTTATNLTLSFTNPSLSANTSRVYRVNICQPASGTLISITWPAGIKWPGASALNLTQTLGVCDWFRFDYDGTTYRYFGGPANES